MHLNFKCTHGVKSMNLAGKKVNYGTCDCVDHPTAAGNVQLPTAPTFIR